MVSIPLSDDAWSSVAHLFIEDNRPRFGRPVRPARQVLDAILWVVVNGEKWQSLPRDFPPAQTCYMKYLKWRRWGILNDVYEQLGIAERVGHHDVD
jgi:transposase